jgi:hypothetical protein
VYLFGDIPDSLVGRQRHRLAVAAAVACSARALLEGLRVQLRGELAALAATAVAAAVAVAVRQALTGLVALAVTALQPFAFTFED